MRFGEIQTQLKSRCFVICLPDRIVCLYYLTDFLHCLPYSFHFPNHKEYPLRIYIFKCSRLTEIPVILDSSTVVLYNQNMELSLVPFSTPLPSRRFLAIGAHALSDKMLELIAKLCLAQRVTVLDCGNRSNMYSVAKLIRPYTTDPVQVMCNIRLSRAFTCYQVAAMLDAAAANPSREPLVVLDLLATFLDEDVKLKDAQRLLEHSLGFLAQLSASAPVVISARPIPPIAQPRAVLLEQLKNNVDVCWEEPPALQAAQHAQMPLFG